MDSSGKSINANDLKYGPFNTIKLEESQKPFEITLTSNSAF